MSASSKAQLHSVPSKTDGEGELLLREDGKPPKLGNPSFFSRSSQTERAREAFERFEKCAKGVSIWKDISLDNC
jgi:hypothetical protein